jgi:hypothetical protein
VTIWDFDQKKYIWMLSFVLFIAEKKNQKQERGHKHRIMFGITFLTTSCELDLSMKHFFLVLVFGDRLLIHKPGWPLTQAPPASASCAGGSQTCSSTSGLYETF